MPRQSPILILLTGLLFEIVAAIGDSSSISRQLQLSEKWWAIQDPDFSYADSQFSFKWTVSDYIADESATYTVYDGVKCKEGNNDITDAMNNYRDINTGAFLQNLGLQPDGGTPYDPLNPDRGDGFRDFRLFLDVQPTLANTDLLYYEADNQNRAIVDFCVRFSLYNKDHREADSVEVNFQETIVTFYIDLTDGFQLGLINVEDREKLERTENIECEIIAYECDDDKIALENPGFLRNQGSETRVCVELTQESKDLGLYLDRVLWFYFLREDPREVQQWSIVMDSEESPDQLTEYNCMRGEEICAFNTILRADFYAWQGISIVRGIGLGLCMLSGGSWLVEDRKRTVGPSLEWYHPNDNLFGSVNQLTLAGFPVGTTVEYTDSQGNFVSSVVSDDTFSVVLGSGDPLSNLEEPAIREALNTLALQAALHTDEDFDLDFIVKVGESIHRYVKPIIVYAVADPPGVAASESLLLDEDGDSVLFQVFPERSADDDNSETLSVLITIPTDSVGPVGSIVELTASPSASMQTIRGGTAFLLQSTGEDPIIREANLLEYTSTAIAFAPRPNWAGNVDILVEAISTEANEVAISNSIAHDTLGDFDTRIETARTTVPVRVMPVVDLPYLTSSQSIVAENNLNTDVDEDAVVAIGELMGVQVDDLDGSQTFQATLVGFPINAINLRFTRSLPDVTTSVDLATGTVAIESSNTQNALEVLVSLQITLANDDDANFVVEVNGLCTDSDGEGFIVEEEYYLSHQVVVQAVADTPTLDAGTELKSVEAEGTAEFRAYPVTVGLNDLDGTETYESVNITLSTPTGVTSLGLEPEVNFGALSPNLLVSHTPGNPAVHVLQGSSEDVEAAMQSLQIRPGYQNGEDITVVVTASAIESNPSETGVIEVAILQVLSVDTFVIPVDPAIEGEPVLTYDVSSGSGDEDTRISLGNFQVELNGTEDADGSEVLYLEVDTTTFPARTRFFINGAEQAGTTQQDDWLRFDTDASVQNSFEVRPPPNFSGEIDFSIRAHIVDYTTSGNVAKISEVSPLSIQVFPVADAIVKPTASTTGIEDLGPVNFGDTLVNTKLKARDRGNGAGNNPEAETFQEIALTIPADSAESTYTLSGPHVPVTSGSVVPGVGSAEVAYDESARTYTITSQTITSSIDVASLSQEDRVSSMQDILDTLETFQVEMGPAHTDRNGVIGVSVTTLDVNLGRFSTKINTFDHEIKIQAVCDTPSITVTPVGGLDEDTSVGLQIEAGPSADVDGSEITFMRILVPNDENGQVPGIIGGTPPSGVGLAEVVPNVYVVTSSSGDTVEDKLALLNSFTNDSLGNGLQFIPSAHWSGKTTLTLQVINLELAEGDNVAPAEYGGPDGDSRMETVTAFLDLTVSPKADEPSILLTANSRGEEDTKIRVFIAVTTQDVDGSETYTVEIDNDLPTGAKLFGAGDTELVANANGKFVLSEADLSELRLLPPLHWSSPLQGDIDLTVTAIVTDLSNTGATDVLVSASQVVPVVVVGVADQAGTRDIIVEAVEDEDYPLGQFFGDLDNVLVDADGSETLSFMIGGFPDMVQVSTQDNAGISYMGEGRYQIDKEAVPSLKISSEPNFAGMNPYPNMYVRAITQEIEGDESISEDWPITIKVQPVADAIEWKMKLEMTEQDNDLNGVGVSFAGALNYTLKDTDGSESVEEMYVDLSNFLANAQVAQRLQDLTGGSTVSDLVDGDWIEGVFAFDATSSVLTVATADITSLKLKADLFLDSNIDFDIPISAKVVDAVTIDGSDVEDVLIQDATLEVKIEGSADVPTVFCDSAISGGRRIPISLGGEATDTDVALGREASERVHYFINPIDMADINEYQFVDASNAIVGFPGGDRTWFLLPEDVQGAQANGGLFMAVRIDTNTSSSTTTATFNLTSVATENDGDVATASTTFTVTSSYDGGPFEQDPLAPIVTIGPNIGVEDVDLALDITLEPDPLDTTNPTLSVRFLADSFPEGSKLVGTFYTELTTGNFVARASDVETASVLFGPTPDFGGSVSINIEGIAVNGSFRYAKSDVKAVPMYFDPVADPVKIELDDVVSDENEEITLNLRLETTDVDGSEALGQVVYMKLCDRVSFVDNYEVVASGDEDALFNETSTVGYSRVDLASVSALPIVPDMYWHGPCDIDVVALSIESEDDGDEDSVRATSASFKATIKAIPTPAVLTAPASVEVEESQYVALTGLSADYVDKIPENGYETLSLLVSNVPEDSLFSQGVNAGNGVWTFASAALLENLEFRPPLYFSGSFTLVFKAITTESSAPGLEAEVTAETLVTVTPVASPFLMVAEAMTVAPGASSGLVLNVRMEDNILLPGETQVELIELTFSSVPADVVLSAPAGGSINGLGGGVWVFEGTEAESNALQLNVGPDVSLGDYDIAISGITKDADSVLPNPSLATLRVTVDPSTTRLLQAISEDIYMVDLPAAQCQNVIGITQDGVQTPKISSSMFTLIEQKGKSVEFRFSPIFSSSDNYYALMLPEAPIGVPVYPVVTSDNTDALTLTANCYAQAATFYIFVNVDGDDTSVFVPNTFDQLSVTDRTSGSSQIYEVTLPCTPCTPELVLERRQRQLVSSKATTPRLHKALAASRNHPRQRQRRQLQQLSNAQGEISMEITMDVPADNSGAIVSNGVSSWILTATGLVMSLMWML